MAAFFSISRIWRMALRSVLFCLLLLLVLMAGGVLWLRTDHASVFLTRTAADVLAKQGLFLEVSAAAGPLPSALRLTDLRLSDREGLFFRADRLEVRMHLPALLRKQIHITAVQLVRPELSRLPLLPPAVDPPPIDPQAPPEPPQFSFASLPITVQLDSLRLEEARVDWALLGLAPPAPPAPETGAADRPIPADAGASVQDNDIVVKVDAPPTLSDIVAATMQHSEASMEADTPPITSDTTVADAEAAHRLVTLIHEAPQQPATINLELSAGLRTGTLTTTANGTVAAGEGLRLHLAVPSLVIALPQPEQLDAAADLHLLVGCDEREFPLILKLKAEMRRSVIRLTAFSLIGLGLDVSVKAEGSLPSTGSATPAESIPPIEGVTAVSSAASVEDTASTIGGSTFAGGAISAGDVTSATAPQLPAFTVAISVNGEKDGFWQALAAALGGLDPAQIAAVGNPLELRVEGSGGDNNPYIVRLEHLRAGVLTASGTVTAGKDAPAAFAAAVESTPSSAVAPSVDTPFSAKAASSTGGNPSAGATSSAEAASPADTDPSAKVAPSADAGPSVEAAPQAAITAASGHRDVSVQADLQAAIEETAVLQPGLGGSLKVSARVLADPRQAEGTVSLSSPALRTPAGVLEALQAQLQGAFASSPVDNALRAEGKLTVQTAKAPGGPAKVDTEFAVALSGASKDNKSGSATLRRLSVSGFGLHVTGDASARLGAALFSPQAGASGLWPRGLSIDGRLSAAVRDWTHIAALSGMRIIGESVTANIALNHTNGTQQAELALDAPSLQLPDQGDLRLSDLVARADLRFTQSQPAADVHVTTASGRAGPLAWSAGDIAVRGSESSGTFSLVLQQDTQKKPSARVESRTRRHGKNNAELAQSRAGGELVKLAGNYDLSKKELLLETLFLHTPEGGPSVFLVKPATVAFAEGLSVKAFELAMTPEGRLKADIAVRPGSLRAEASVTALPLVAVSDLTGAPLPDGYFNAALSARTGAGGPTADLTAELRLRKPGRRFNRDVTGSGAASLRTKTPAAQADSAAPQAELKAASTTTGAGRTAGAAQSGMPAQSGLPAQAEPADITLKAALARSGGRLQLRGTMDMGFAALSLRTDPAAQAERAVSTAPSSRAAPVTFSVPVRLNESALPLPDMHGPLSAEIRWLGPVDPFWQLLPLPDQTFSGEASVNINVKGTPAAPKISGAVLLAGGTFEDRAQGILLDAVDAEVRLQPDGTVHLAALVKDAAEGTFAAEGQTRLGGQDPSLRLRAQAKHFAPLHRDDLNIIFSGIFGVSGPLSALNIHSSILLERGEVLLLSSLTGGSVPTLEISEPGSDFITKASGPLCDLTIDIPRRFFVRGRGLDSEWQGRLHIGGYLSEPQLTGSLKPVRGQFELLSRPFAFTGGNIAFAGGKQINPSVNLELTYETSALEAIIRTSGTLKKFALELESKPPYPRDEVLAQVLFGKNASALSRFEAVQLAAGLSELAGMGSGLNPLTAIRQATGLDVLRVGGGSSSQGRGSSQSGNALQAGGASQNGGSGEDDTGPSLEAGKYINDSIYIGVEQGVSTEDTAVRVEIELFPHVNLQGRTSPTSSQAGVGWKMDY